MNKYDRFCLDNNITCTSIVDPLFKDEDGGNRKRYFVTMTRDKKRATFKIYAGYEPSNGDVLRVLVREYIGFCKSFDHWVSIAIKNNDERDFTICDLETYKTLKSNSIKVKRLIPELFFIKEETMTELQDLCIDYIVSGPVIAREGHKSKRFGNHKSWWCVLECDGRNDIFLFYSNEIPVPEDVIYSYISESYALDCSFKEWCSDFGYNTDSIDALKTYRICRKNGKKIRRLLGDKFEEFRDAEY